MQHVCSLPHQSALLTLTSSTPSRERTPPGLLGDGGQLVLTQEEVTSEELSVDAKVARAVKVGARGAAARAPRVAQRRGRAAQRQAFCCGCS